MREKLLLGILAIATLLISTFLVVALVTNQNNSDKSELSERQESLKLLPLVKISEDEAKTIALGEVNSKGLYIGIITDIELERENENIAYAVEFTKNEIETDVKIDAMTGKVLKIESDLDEKDNEDEKEDIPILSNALERASEVALEYIGEGGVTDTEIGDEEGYYEIEVTLDNGQEVDVHLDKDFKVLSKEIEGNNEEDED